MALTSINPWQVSSLEAFSYLCCPECVFRSKEEIIFQDHAVHMHPQSMTFFGENSNRIVNVKEEPFDDYEQANYIENAVDPSQLCDANIATGDFEKYQLNETDIKAEVDNKDLIDINKTDKENEEKVKNFKCQNCPFATHVKKSFKAHRSWCPGTEEGLRGLEEKRRKQREARRIKKEKQNSSKDTEKETEPGSIEVQELNKKRKIEKNVEVLPLPGQDFKCKDCPFVTHGKDIKESMRVHQSVCPGTEKGLRNLEEKRRRQREARRAKGQGPKEDNRTYVCVECKDTYETSQAYIAHYRKNHGGIWPPDLSDRFQLHCDKCLKTFASTETLKNHQERDHVELKDLTHECSECNLKFNLKMYIEHFRKEHNQIPPEAADKQVYYCDKCPKFFFLRGKLNMHMKVHSESLFQCKDCPKIFKSKSNYTEHRKKVHLQYTPFSCDQCPKKFAMKRTLKTHIDNVHSRVKCEICLREICNSFMLKRHKAESHGIYPPNALKCELCPMFFTVEKTLISHMRSKHQMNAE